MTRVGLEGRTELIADAGHGWYGPDMKRTMDQTFDFFEMLYCNVAAANCEGIILPRGCNRKQKCQ